MNMNRFVFILAIIGLLSCMACNNESSDKPDKPEKENGISAKKMCWNIISTKADEAETGGEKDQRDTICLFFMK